MSREEGSVGRDGEEGENGEVGCDRGEEEGEKIGCGLGGVQIGAGERQRVLVRVLEGSHLGEGRDLLLGKFLYLCLSESEDLVYIFQAVRVAAEREVDE